VIDGWFIPVEETMTPPRAAPSSPPATGTTRSSWSRPETGTSPCRRWPGSSRGRQRPWTSPLRSP